MEYPDDFSPSLSASGPGGMIISLPQANGNLSLWVQYKGEQKGPHRVPGDISAFDLPYWISSILLSIKPDLTQGELNGYQSSLRRAFPSKEQLFTICLGPRAQFYLHNTFHLPKEHVPAQQGSIVNFKGKIRGDRFTTNHSWTFLFLTSSEVAAKHLEWEIKRSQELLISRDGDVKGIVAFNSQRWETSGVAEQDVIRLAEERGIRLEKLESSDSVNLAFWVVGR